jgi:hypothetical protein
MARRSSFASALALLGLGATLLSSCRAPSGNGSETSPPPLPQLPGLDRPVAFDSDVKPVLENRCVVCHGCDDAPCQLLFSSYDGATRGASKQAVYDTSRLETMQPTRLGIDARTTAEWRAKGFFPMLGGAAPAAESGAPADDGDALMIRMLALGVAHPFVSGQRLPDGVPLGVDRTLTCPEGGEFAAYARKFPQGGMPYGTAPLAPEELRVLASWVSQGAPQPPAPAPLPAAAAAQVATWEAFLNGASLKERIVGRYLYEHWFVAHLYFDDLPTGPFFRIVRSRTGPGQPTDEIPTVRPYDDPGGPFSYRLQPIRATIVEKTHIVYPLDVARLARLRRLFLEPAWTPTQFPSYAPEVASNPFVAFAEVPARSRYQFLLDDAQYFVMTFIRGPVCRGQVAVDVIEDQFFVTFLDPDRDPSVILPEFLPQTMHLLDLPAEHSGHYLPGRLWIEYAAKQREYLIARTRYYDVIDPKHVGPALDWIWDGDGANPNALLTVFRNFDNATVVKGFVGGMPKTAWTMDFPILERIYYDLVAGYNVFGDVVHQVATRLYMDHLRMQSENLFLTFLPADRRDSIRASWYVGATHELDYSRVDRLRALDHGTQIRFPGPDVKADLLTMILRRSPKVAGPPDTLNRCARPPCDRADATPAERAVERELQRLASVRGAWVAFMPEVAPLRVRTDATGSHDLVYNLVHNDAHTNVAFMFGENDRRIPADDTLTVVRGHFGSYPNFFFEVEANATGSFVKELRAVTSDSELERFVERHGIRRTEARFWSTSDWLRDHFRRRAPTEAGVYDLGRYDNL